MQIGLDASLVRYFPSSPRLHCLSWHVGVSTRVAVGFSLLRSSNVCDDVALLPVETKRRRTWRRSVRESSREVRRVVASTSVRRRTRMRVARRIGTRPGDVRASCAKEQLRCPACNIPLRGVEAVLRHMPKCCVDIFDEEQWRRAARAPRAEDVETVLADAMELEKKRREEAVLAAFVDVEGCTKGRRSAARRAAAALGLSTRRANALLLGASRSEPLRPWPIPLHVLHECESLVVVDKPPGVRAQPRHRFENESLLNAVIAHVGTDQEVPRTVHRLDMDTTGVTVFAKTKEAARIMQSQFENRSVQKAYLAVTGAPDVEGRSWTTEAAIERQNEGEVAHRCVDEGGKGATTKFKCLASAQDVSLVAAMPTTGRTHQIRLHLQREGRPIVGDDLYGCRSEIISRHALHAAALQVMHPTTMEQMLFLAPLPEDIVGLMEQKGLPTDMDWSAMCAAKHF